MKITKGMKLTPEQKAQRAESRQRNQERWLREDQERRRIQAAKDAADTKRLEALRAELALLEAEGRRFVIQITEEEKQSLLEISRRFFAKHHPAVESAASWAIKFALCHPDQLLNWTSGVIRYEKAEGINQREFTIRKIAMEAKRLAKERV